MIIFAKTNNSVFYDLVDGRLYEKEIIHTNVDVLGTEYFEISEVLSLGELNFLGDINLSNVADNHFFVYDNASSKWINKSPSDSIIALGITATTAELNLLDGVTATTAELNYLDITTLGVVEASKALTANIDGDVTIEDGDTFRFGTGFDMTLYHDGSDSYITNASGALKIATETSGIAVQIGHATSEVTIGDNLTVTGNLSLSGQSGDLALNNQKITNLGTPTADSDAATKSYVDSVAQGLDIYNSVKVATTASFTMASTASTTTLVLADGEGGFDAGADTLTIDGISLSQDDRVLIKNGVNSASAGVSNKWNGIYTVGDLTATSLTLTRAADMDVPAEFKSGAFFFVEKGTLNADIGYVLITDGTVTVGTSDIEFTQFSSSGDVTAGDGLAKVGNELSVNVDNSSIEIISDILRVKAGGITSAMLAGSIANSKLNQLTTANKVALSSIDIDGATPLGSISDTDLFIVDNNAAGNNYSAEASDIAAYTFGKVSGQATIAANGALTIDNSIITSQTEITSLQTTDKFLVMDDSNFDSLKSVNLSNLITSGFTSATAETSIADTDEILIYDTSIPALRKMTKANFVSGLGGISNVIDDTTPQLGGNLDVVNNAIGSYTGAGELVLVSNGASTAINLVNIASSQDAALRFYNDSNNSVTLKTPSSIASDFTLILPNSDGSANQVLKTDGSGNLGWVSQSATVALDDIGVGDAESTLATTSGDIIIHAQGVNSDIRIRGNDGGSTITPLRFDMSENGQAIYATDIFMNSNRKIDFYTYSNSQLGAVRGRGTNNNSQDVVYNAIEFEKSSGSPGSESGKILFKNMFLGSFDTSLEISSNGVYQWVNIPQHNGSSNKGLALGGVGVSATAAELNILDGVTATTAELNVMDGGTSATATTLVDADRVVVNDAGTMKQVAMTDVMTYVNANVSGGGGSTALDDITAGDAASTLTTTVGNITIDAQGADTDIIFKGTTGTTDTTFLTLDGSDSGTAIFNKDVKLQSDNSKLYFGADDDVWLSHSQDTGLLLNVSPTTVGEGEPLFLITSAATTTSGPTLKIRHGVTDAAADNDVIGSIVFEGENSVGLSIDYGVIRSQIADASFQDEAGRLEFYVASNGANGVNAHSYTKAFVIEGTGTSDNITCDVIKHDGTSSGLKLGSTLVTATAAELNIMDGGTSATATTLVDADRVVVNDAGTMKQVAMTDVMTYVNANVSAGGGTSYTYSAVSAATVTGAAWYHYSVDASSNAVTINLPALSGLTDGDEIRVKVRDNTNTVTIDANSTETIDGNQTLVLNTLYSSITLVAGSTEWEII